VKHSVESSARFSNLKVDIRELSCLFMQEPTESKPLWALWLITTQESNCPMESEWPWS